MNPGPNIFTFPSVRYEYSRRFVSPGPDCQSLGAIIAKKRAEQTNVILRDWMREELGSECPAADEDIAIVAIGLGYRFERIVPPTGDTETLALFRNQNLVRSIGVRRPF